MFILRSSLHQQALAMAFAKKMLPMERKEALELQGRAHRLGFSSPHLRGCLFMVAGGKKFNNQHTVRHLTKLGFLQEGQKLSLTGIKLLEYFDKNSTAKIGLGFQESTNCDVANAAIKKASGTRGLIANFK